jgi:L-serine dehydratase
MESISVFEIIKIGIGPSSSHTMGPWKAANLFLQVLKSEQLWTATNKIKICLYGSLAKTGKGHGTDLAACLGLTGQSYETIDTGTVNAIFDTIKKENRILSTDEKIFQFVYEEDLVFNYKENLPQHPNGINFSAVDKNDALLFSKNYFSVGGGFVTEEHRESINAERKPSRYPCHDAASIKKHCAEFDLRVSDLVMLNEATWEGIDVIKAKALNIWKEIKDCIYRGINKTGELPGGLHVKRRASEINEHLLQGKTHYTNVDEWITYVKLTGQSFNTINKWISCFALAVNEENAAFGRIVTAPTNGAAGVLPAVLMYAYCFLPDFDEDKIVRYILTAGEIGTLYKKKATISAAMGGCQAEIGVSSSMAAAGLTEALFGSVGQVLQAAEIAMEHHLGMTCDPIGGLVQIPCIERNSMGAIKAITASNIALESDPEKARVSLDDVIKTMWQTALDMNTKYKETSEGGLAINISVNLAEC